jgi:hypothetical protein
MRGRKRLVRDGGFIGRNRVQSVSSACPVRYLALMNVLKREGLPASVRLAMPFVGIQSKRAYLALGAWLIQSRSGCNVSAPWAKW